MQILELIQANEGPLKKQATNGGEYAGACPWCGGKDRFRVWPETGRFWCRQCGKAGDEIDYLRERRGLSFKEACQLTGRKSGPHKHSLPPAPSWIPREAAQPKAFWQMKAGNFLSIAINSLWSKQGESVRAWLKAEKGLSDATIKKSLLGYSPMDIDEPRSAWGLEPLLKDGTQMRQCIPAGLVIPLIKNNKVMRLRIRRDNPDDGARYIVVSGSSPAPLIIGQDKGAAVIVENELDAWLLHETAGDLVAVVALGNAQAKPDIETDKLLQDTPVILISLDTDDAGGKTNWIFWRDNYEAKRWPAIKGKTLSEARLNGLDLRSWVIAGMCGTETMFERFCLLTMEGNLSDTEALLKIKEMAPCDHT
ncbi:MAG TPA: primase-helicase zinc-binding domain-containing protein [Smithella sp.]|nr:hypothetical protein [Smithella sp.]MDM7986992.1 primase-helicase zinc-binding domain-containing protein [Smithella sp.]HNY50171.1 primase-helicase zinc-binding domain-containing protein [Smithella sp.]HOG89512.1 primase-helicase zinc-binding domain-containing protein [Smithella sp.]HOU51994.1 primase-helicase zinc-binding domain-containing protein [Smithella sp.]